MYAKYHKHHAFSWSIMILIYQPLCVQVNCHSGVGGDCLDGALCGCGRWFAECWPCCPAGDITDRSPPQSSQPSRPVCPCNAQFSFKLVSPHSPPPAPPNLPTPPTLGH